MRNLQAALRVYFVVFFVISKFGIHWSYDRSRRKLAAFRYAVLLLYARLVDWSCMGVVCRILALLAFVVKAKWANPGFCHCCSAMMM